MKKRRYGRTGLYVSEICLGAGRLSWLGSLRESFAVLDAFADVGGNFIQTSARALLPGVVEGPLRSEDVVGAWLKEHPGLRENLVLSTRIRCPRGVAGLALENAIRNELEGSLRRLETPYVDVLLMDWTAEALPTESVMAVVDQLAKAGMLRYAGAVGLPCWRVAEWLGRVGSRGGIRLEAAHVEGPYLEHCFNDLAQALKIALVSRWPFAGDYDPLVEPAKAMGASTLEAGLSWLLSHETLSSVQVAAGAAWQVLEANRATEIELSEEQRDRLASACLRSAFAPRCHETPNCSSAPEREFG